MILAPPTRPPIDILSTKKKSRAQRTTVILVLSVVIKPIIISSELKLLNTYLKVAPNLDFEQA
jgi:hypothetical protein